MGKLLEFFGKKSVTLVKGYFPAIVIIAALGIVAAFIGFYGQNKFEWWHLILPAFLIWAVWSVFHNWCKYHPGQDPFDFGDTDDNCCRKKRQVTADDVRDAAQRMIRSDYVPPTQEELDEARSEDRQVTAEDVREAARRMFNN